MIYERTYDPRALHFIRCLVCGRLCLPFPHANSGNCSWCFYVNSMPGSPQRPEEASPWQ